jgi:hypothetical protein
MTTIISVNDVVSDTFEVPIKSQITLYATGLQASDHVIVEMVGMSGTSGGDDVCCPSPVSLPEVTSAAELKCRSGKTMRLTAEHPFLVLDAPQGVPMQARVVSDMPGFITVELISDTNSSGCLACACS